MTVSTGPFALSASARAWHRPAAVCSPIHLQVRASTNIIAKLHPLALLTQLGWRFSASQVACPSWLVLGRAFLSSLKGRCEQPKG